MYDYLNVLLKEINLLNSDFSIFSSEKMAEQTSYLKKLLLVQERLTKTPQQMTGTQKINLIDDSLLELHVQFLNLISHVDQINKLIKKLSEASPLCCLSRTHVNIYSPRIFNNFNKIVYATMKIIEKLNKDIDDSIISVKELTDAKKILL